MVVTWFTRLRDWTTDQANGIGIRSDYHDQEDDNFATGINACLNIAGLNSPTSNISMGGFKLTNAANGTSASDYATVGQVQSRVVAYAADSVGTDAYAITLSPALAAYAVGQQFVFAAGAANVGAASLNISGLGAKSIKKNYNADLSDGDIAQNQMITVIYDGTNFQMQTPPHGLISQSMSEIYAADGGGSDSYAITLSPAISSYGTGQLINFKANTKNTGAATLNINGLGAKTIKKDGGADLADGDIAANQIVQVIYDGTNFQLLSQVFGAIGQNGGSIYAADVGGTDSYAITLSPAPTAYTTGMVVRFKANTINTGAATLNCNSLGAISIVKNYNSTLADGDIKANQIVEVIYDGTNFQLISPIANTGTVTSVATGSGLSGGTITGSGTLTVAAGVPIQVVSVTKTSVFTTSSTTLVDVTGLTLSITPSSATNTILIICQLPINGYTGNTGAFANLVRGSTSVFVGDAAGSRVQATTGDYAGSNLSNTTKTIVYLDSPATTSATTYKIQARAGTAAAISIGASILDTNSADNGRLPCSITAIEFKA